MGKQSTFGKLGNDIIRGFGLKTGRSLATALENQVKTRTLDSNSKFRKQISRFTLTGDFNKDVKKLLSLIEQFNEEYTRTKAIFQKDFHLIDDISFIDSKLEFLQSMIIDSEEESTHIRITKLWSQYRSKF